jgi:hypothetical protein
MGTGLFPGVERLGVALNANPHSANVKERVVFPLLPLWAFMAGYRLKCTSYFNIIWCEINIYEIALYHHASIFALLAKYSFHNPDLNALYPVLKIRSRQ